MGKPHSKYTQPDPTADLATGAEVRNRYTNAAATLFGVMLASPHEAAERLNELDTVYFQDTEYHAAAKALFTLLEQRKEASVRGVAMLSKFDEDALYLLTSKNASLDFDTALNMFLPVYQFYVEWVACTTALIHTEADGGTAEEVQAVAQMIREKRRQYIAPPADDYADLDAWMRVKLDGYEYDHICKPHLDGLKNTGLLTAFEPGCMYVIAARPNMGKTHFVCGLINEFESAGARGVFFSADMDKLNIHKRLIGLKSAQNPRKDWSILTPNEREDVSNAHAWVKGLKCRIIDNVVDLSRVQAICSAENYREPINYIIFDYLQLFRVEGMRDRYSTVTAASIAVKQMSKAFGVPVIVLSQLSRANESRGGSNRPFLSDLRDSGAIEENATWVSFLHRPEYYGVDKDEQGNPTKGIGEIIVAKSQTGETGICAASFDGVAGWSDFNTPSFLPPSTSTQFPAAAAPMPVTREESNYIPF